MPALFVCCILLSDAHGIGEDQVRIQLQGIDGNKTVAPLVQGKIVPVRVDPHPFGCSRITIPTGEMHRLVVPHIEKTDATTAVAMSPDGRFVAFGYANGTVRIYETGQLTFLFEHNGIGEAVSALRFSDDNRVLYMFGSSGNLYHGDVPDFVLSGDPPTAASWNALVRSLTQKRQKYLSGLPSDE